jgi:uncharacterized membrane protein (DUF373 family)
MNQYKSKLSIAIADLLMIAAMVVCYVSSDMEKGGHGEAFRHAQDFIPDFSWATLHSISSLVFTALILIHLIQHWNMIRNIIVKNLYSRNIMTSITAVTFIITVLSFAVYLTGFSHGKGEFHGTTANIFLISGGIHLVLNLTKLAALFKGRPVERKIAAQA